MGLNGNAKCSEIISIFIGPTTVSKLIHQNFLGLIINARRKYSQKIRHNVVVPLCLKLERGEGGGVYKPSCASPRQSPV